MDSDASRSARGPAPSRRAEKAGIIVHADARVALEWILHGEAQIPGAGSADLVYLDPPFRHGDMFPSLPDDEASASWQAALGDVLFLTRRLLAPTGSVWWHVDPPNSEVSHALLSDVFDQPAHAATVVWRRQDPWSVDHLIVYSPEPDRVRAKLRDPAWAHDGLGTMPDARREVADLFPDEPPFPHPKPQLLLQRIIEVTTAPGDLVVDPFSGSGTTAAAAAKTGRRWIAIERDATTIDRFTLPRIARYVPLVNVVSLECCPGQPGCRVTTR